MAFDLKDAGIVETSSAGDNGIVFGSPSIASPRPIPYTWAALWAYIQSKSGDAIGYDVGTAEGEIPLLGPSGKLPHAQMNLADVPLTGTPTAPTASPGTNTQQLANTAFVQAAITALINAAPGALDTLDELAAALGDDANFAATVTSALALKAPLASPSLTGTPTAPTASFGTNTQQIATMAAVEALLNGAEATVASATTCDIGAAASTRVHVSGTTTVTSFGAVANKVRVLRFSDALTLTHHATSLILPTATNITTAADDTAIVVSDGSGNWRCVSYQRASGTPLASSINIASQTDAEAGTNNTDGMTPLRTVQSINALGLIASRNAWINGGFEVWQRGTGSTTATAATRNFLADRVYVNPAGADATQQRSTSVPTGSRARYSLQVTGAASVTTCLIGQRIEAAEIPAIKRTITVTAKIENGTGGAFTPNLLIGTPGATDDFTTVTNRLTQALQSCADAAWTTVTHTVDISGYTNVDNGLQVEFQVPSGSLDAGGKSVRITEVSVGPNTTFAPMPRVLEAKRCQRFYAKTYNLDVAPGTVTKDGALGGACTPDTQTYLHWPFPAAMRAVPTVTLWNPVTGASGTWRTSGATDTSGIDTSSVGATGTDGIFIYALVSANVLVHGHLTLNAEL